MHTLSAGKWRGLKATSTDEGHFTILAFDQRGSLESMVGDSFDYQQGVTIKQDMVVPLSQHVSAVLLDAQYGMPAAVAMSGHSGLLLALEETGYTGESTYRKMAFSPDWTVANIKAVGAAAVKLLVYYHPEAGALAEEVEQMVADVAAQCKEQDIALFVEPVSYSLDAAVKKDSPEFAQKRPRIVAETARRLTSLGMDILKMEFPCDAKYQTDTAQWLEACHAVSEVATVPWVLLSAGVDFDVYQQQLEIACQGGASGFLAGRAIWKEGVKMSADARRQFTMTTAVERIKQLSSITATHAHSWTDCFAPPAFDEGWYQKAD